MSDPTAEPATDPIDAVADETALLRQSVMADIARIAAALEIPRGLSYRRYIEAGGDYRDHTISELGGWIKMCEAAGVRSSMRGGNSKGRRKVWQKSSPRQDSALIAKFDAALKRAVERPLPTKRSIFVMGSRVRPGGPRGPRHVIRRDLPQLERGEIIADIRQIAQSTGLLSPALLTWETYRAFGGRYSHEQIIAFGGFPALRRAMQ